MRKPDVPIVGSVSIAFESNGKGCFGHVIEYPGAFVRGRTEAEALGKVQQEVKSYLAWLGRRQKPGHLATDVPQRHHCSLMIEDADSEVLLDADIGETTSGEFDEMIKLCRYSGSTFVSLYEKAKFKDWVDDSKRRKTFYGDALKTIGETFNHVKRVQYYYLSRAKIPFGEKSRDFLEIRRHCLDELRKSFERNKNSIIFDVDNESWTLKKILRRYVLHDRIHGKAIVRMLEKQKRQAVIRRYDDPFRFEGV